MDTNDETQDPLVENQEDAAAADAASIGGEGTDSDDPARQPVEEAGGGVEEGFEQAEDDLVENASHGDGRGNPQTDAIDNENVEAERSTADYGEADELDTPDA